MRSIASSLFTWFNARVYLQPTLRSTRDARPISHEPLLVYALLLTLSVGVMSLRPASVHAACLLAYDNAAPVQQGDALGRVGSHLGGGVSHWGAGAGGQLGLSGDRSLHLRSGACARSEITGWAIETGVTQRLMVHRGHLSGDERAPYFSGPLDLGLRLTLSSFAGDQHNGEARSDLGVQVVTLLSYPLWFDKRSTSAVGRVRFARATVGLALGLSSYATDRRQLVQPESPLSSERDTLLSSRWTWSELIALSAHYYMSDRSLLSVEMRWAEGGVLTGLSIGYQL